MDVEHGSNWHCAAPLLPRFTYGACLSQHFSFFPSYSTLSYLFPSFSPSISLTLFLPLFGLCSSRRLHQVVAVHGRVNTATWLRPVTTYDRSSPAAAPGGDAPPHPARMRCRWRQSSGHGSIVRRRTARTQARQHGTPENGTCPVVPLG